MAIRVLVGLGNPGREYAFTRHNMGFLVIDALVRECKGRFVRESQFEARVAHVVIHDMPIDVVEPHTYMNLSGRAVAKFLEYHKMTLEEILVVVDDMALPLGEMKLDRMGGARGHNGLKSIRDTFNSQNFARLRVGIGDGDDTKTDHVLGGFTEEEMLLLPGIITEAKEMIKKFIDTENRK